MQGIWLVAFVLQWIVLLALLLLVAGLFRYLGSMQGRSELALSRATQLEQGERIDHFVLNDLQGHPVDSKTLLKGKSLLFFVSAGCQGCQTMLKQVAELANREAGLKGLGWTFAFICYGTQEQVEAFFKTHLPTEDITVLLDEKGTISTQFAIRSVPVGVALDERARVIDQSMNPHVDWLYQVLNVPAPLEDPDPIKAVVLSNR